MKDLEKLMQDFDAALSGITSMVEAMGKLQETVQDQGGALPPEALIEMRQLLSTLKTRDKREP